MVQVIRKALHAVNRKNALFLLGSLALCLGTAHDAYAIPAFARQTGQECSACHIGSFGPQLTEYGRNFKLYGYQFGDEIKNPLQHLSAMAYGGMEHTNEGQRQGVELTGHEARYSPNNNWTLDQASIFYGGKVYGNIGMMAQATYSGPNEQLSWDNTDIRYADATQIGDKTIVYGITVNNNPSVQDVWQTAPAWRFPFLSSTLMPSPAASPYITTLAQSVVGAGAYSMWNNLVYAEFSAYATLPNHAQQAMGITGSDQSDHLSSLAPYWRVALQHDFGPHYVEVGTYGLYADRYPGNVRDFGSDNIIDYAVDASYQFTTANGLHNVSVYGSALHERDDLAASFASGGSANTSDYLNEVRANASYYYKNAYGITFSHFNITGSADSTLYANPVNNKPNSSGWTTQMDFTPFGTLDSWGYPYCNVRFFVQYTAYDKFNGLSSNYDGTGRNASDNNTLFFGTWFAF